MFERSSTILVICLAVCFSLIILVAVQEKHPYTGMRSIHKISNESVYDLNFDNYKSLKEGLTKLVESQNSSIDNAVETNININELKKSIDTLNKQLNESNNKDQELKEIIFGLRDSLSFLNVELNNKENTTHNKLNELNDTVSHLKSSIELLKLEMIKGKNDLEKINTPSLEDVLTTRHYEEPFDTESTRNGESLMDPVIDQELKNYSRLSVDSPENDDYEDKVYDRIIPSWFDSYESDTKSSGESNNFEEEISTDYDLLTIRVDLGEGVTLDLGSFPSSPLPPLRDDPSYHINQNIDGSTENDNLMRDDVYSEYIEDYNEFLAEYNDPDTNPTEERHLRQTNCDLTPEIVDDVKELTTESDEASSHLSSDQLDTLVSQFHNSNKTYFLHITKKLTFLESMITCGEKLMQLASIRNLEEQEQVVALIKETGEDFPKLLTEDFWVSGVKIDDNDFAWVPNPHDQETSMNYTNWNQGEPTIYPNPTELNQWKGCVILGHKHGYQWSSVQCAEGERYAVCEKQRK